MTAVKREATTNHVGRPRAVAGAAVRHRARVPMPRPVSAAADALRGQTEPDRPGPTASLLTVVVAGLAALALLTVAVVAVVRAGGASGPGVGEAFVQVHGIASVVRADGSRHEMTGRGELAPGDRFTMVEGRADLELAGDVTFAATAAAGPMPAASLTMAEEPVLDAGQLLVSAPAGTTVAAGAGDGRVQVASDSVARLTRTAALRVGLYQGSATVTSAGVTRHVPTYRHVEVVGAGEVSRPMPLTYAQTDPWDRTHLAAAIALDRELGAIVDGLTADRVDPVVLPERVRRQLDEAPAATTLADLVAERAPGLDNAVAVAVAGNGTRAFVDSWKRLIPFHDAGARWGLAALDLGADPDAVVDDLLASLEGDPVPTVTEADPVASEPAVTASTTVTTGDPITASDAPAADDDSGRAESVGPGAESSGPAPTSAPSAPSGPSGTAPAPAPTPTTTPGVVGPVLEPLNPVVEPLAPVLDPVTGTVRDLGGGLVETVDGLVEPLDPLLGGVTDPLVGEDGLVPGLLGGLLGP